MKRLIAVLALLAAVVGPAAAQAASRTPEPARVVLPDAVRPERYAIRIAPDAAALRFEGRETVDILVLRATDRIVLNAADLAFRTVSLEGRAPPKVVLDKARQTAAFVFATPLEPGHYKLSIDYSGQIFQQASGFFALDYGAGAAKQRALFTQFENSDARRFAPMWDEPGVKSVFSLSVEAPTGQLAVSNMPVAETAALAPGRQLVRFADTPKMSAYLLFLALGDFERVHRQVGATDVGVVVRRGDTAKAGFALDAAAELLPYYNDYFGVPYPLPKLDFIAGPGRSQFFSAMENWGAIFYFDYALLVDPQLTTQAEKQDIYVDIAHEMAHQWFGDLVTMAWWDDLWLNEGFASWMENKATDRFHPEWRIWLRTKAGEQRAMAIDSKAGAHPVITAIPDVFAAANAFDAITYQKGHMVIRMLEAYVGEDVFRAGVRNYIAAHAYGNTVTDDLWREIDKVSPRKVADIAHDFTLQSGVPLIAAASAPGGVALSQSRYGLDAASLGKRSWRTPVVATGEGAAWRGVVSDGQTVVAPLKSPVLLNAGQAGYFRSRYAPELWAPLAARFAGLAPEDQLGLIYDRLALGEAGVGPMGDFLDLARRAQDAENPVVLEALAQQLLDVDSFYDGLPTQAGYRAFARARLAPAFARLGWDPRAGESDSDGVLRAALLAALGRLDDPAVTAEARRRLSASAGPTGGSRQAVIAIAAGKADPATWETLHRMAREATDINDKSRLYRALGSSHDPALADRALALSLSGEPPATDAPTLIASVGEVFPDKALAFALAHRQAVDAMLEQTSRTTFFARLADGSSNPAMLEQLRRFAATVPPSSRGDVDKAMAAVRFRHAVVAQRLPEVDRWLAAHPG